MKRWYVTVTSGTLSKVGCSTFKPILSRSFLKPCLKIVASSFELWRSKSKIVENDSHFCAILPPKTSGACKYFRWCVAKTSSTPVSLAHLPRSFQAITNLIRCTSNHRKIYALHFFILTVPVVTVFFSVSLSRQIANAAQVHKLYVTTKRPSNADWTFVAWETCKTHPADALSGRAISLSIIFTSGERNSLKTLVFHRAVKRMLWISKQLSQSLCRYLNVQRTHA